MTATTATLASFLTQRLDEDEAVARAAVDTNSRYVGDKETAYEELVEMSESEGCQPEAVAHIARHDPARVLAEVAAKRQIVELHPVEEVTAAYDSRTATRLTEAYCGGCQYDEERGEPFGSWPCPTMVALASVYADHPDFREEWR